LAGPGHMPEAAKALWENIGGEAVVLWNTTREKDPKVVMGRTFLRDNP